MKKRILAILLWTVGIPIVVFHVWVAIFAFWPRDAAGRINVYDVVIWASWGSMVASPLAGLGLGACGILPGTKRGERAPS